MPKTSLIGKLIPSLTITILLLNLLAPVGIAFAQDGEPPPDPPPAEEVAAEEQPVEEEEAPPTEEPTEQEEPVDEEAPAEDTQPGGEETPEGQDASNEGSEVDAPEGADTEVVEGSETEGSETEEGNPVAEAVQALDEANAVLLDENGEPLPMASQETAEALSVADPYFCPAGGGACTGAQASIAAAIADWQGLGSPSGTFFIEGGASFAGITFTENIAGIDLVFQGGDGGGVTTINTAFSVTNSTFNSITFNNITFGAGLDVLNSTGTVNINDVIASGVAGDGIEITNHDGSISVDNVTASNNTNVGDGLDIQQIGASTNTVSVTNSTFNGNTDEGMQITTTGAITINNVTANSNQGIAGAALANINLTSDAPVDISNSTFNNNTNGEGLLIGADGALTLTNITATGNGDDGVEAHNFLASVDAAVTITGGAFSGNGGDGLEVDSNGQITVSNVTANSNTGGSGDAGLDLDNTNSASNAGITLTNVTAEMNANDGIKGYSDGAITLNNVNANNNDDDGAELWNDFDMTSDAYVNVFNSNFNGNGATAVEGIGLEILSYGAVTVDGVSASNNQGSSDNIGLAIDNTGFGNDAAVSVSNSAFNNNVGDTYGAGLIVLSDGKITLNSIYANLNGNTGSGFDYDALGAVLNNETSASSQGVLVENSSFNGNFGEDNVAGLIALSGGSITLKNVSANDNTSTTGDAGGAVLDNGAGMGVTDVDSSVKVSNSNFNNNTGGNSVGLLIYSQGNINLWNVNANGNGVDGVDLQIDSSNGPHNTSIICSSMQSNGEVGILVDGSGGDLNIFSTETSGNGLAALGIINVGNTNFGMVNCDPDKDDHRDGKHAPLDPKDPTTIVLDLYPHSVTFPPMNLLECEGFVKSLFYMSDLPNEVPEGDNFLRAMKIRLEGCEIPDGGMFTIGFDIPAAEQGNEFAVLFWDSDTDSWIEIPGGQLTEDGRYTVSWPETGTFVLVTR